ncbi:MAG: GEVED domain-containing protein [Candidatus Nanopelagicales bacterium]
MPADYNTLNADGGAYHIITDTLQIGANIDADADGQPNGSATGDDAVGSPDDEDGVTLPATSAASFRCKTITVSAVVSNNTGSDAVLYGFIDWNADGDFGDAGEVVTATVTDGTTAGTVNLVYAMPTDANATELLGARFRLSTDSTLGPDGIAPDGEVEDYMLQVTAAGPAIDVTKYTNGYDADAVTGPNLAVGSTVTWTYIVRNSGNVPVTATVSDDVLGAVTSCDSVTLPAVLQAGQVVTCTVEWQCSQWSVHEHRRGDRNQHLQPDASL